MRKTVYGIRFTISEFRIYLISICNKIKGLINNGGFYARRGYKVEE